MLSVKKLVESALECLGWPYVSPGTNDRNGIDCSGLWVKCFRDQGAKIYHGSNTIFRDYCSETGKLTSADQLQVGMAVFKRKDWTDGDKSNRWYGKEPGNLSHIGMVTSVNPLVITHATSPVCTQDKKIGKWAYWGKVKDVDYEDGPSPAPQPDPDPEPVVEKRMKVYASSGSDVFMRSGPGINYKFIIRILIGTIVTVIGYDGDWSRIRYADRIGWMMSKFLVDPEAPDPEPSPEPSPDPAPDPEPDPHVIETDADIWSGNGKPVKMRAKPSKSCKLYDELPVGTTVHLTGVIKVADGEEWYQANHGVRNGWWIMSRFLSVG